MSEFRVASRYAKSLLDLAKEKNIINDIYNDILLFNNTLSQNNQLVSLFKSPVINGNKKFAVVKSIFGSKLNALTIAFIEIIIRKRREMFLLAVAEAFIAQYKDLNNIVNASLKTAVAINDNLTAEVRNFIEKQSGKKIDLTIKVEPNLIGGMVIQIEDKLYDASIAGKLKKAKKELLNTYISK